MPCGEVWIALNTGYNQQWGFQVTAQGTVEIEVAQVPWIVDILRTTSLAAGRIAASLTAANLLADPKAADPEKGCSSWLDCELLGEGLPVSLADTLGRTELAPLLEVCSLVGTSTDGSGDASPFGAGIVLSEAEMKVCSPIRNLLSNPLKIMAVFCLIAGFGCFSCAKACVCACRHVSHP